MSLLPGLTQSAPGVSLFASASGGGGGGGPNPIFSTITLNDTAGVGVPNINFAGDNAVIASINGIQFTDSPYTNSEIDLSPQNPPVISMFNNSNVQAMIIGTTADGYGYIGQSGPGAQGIQLENISSINGAAPGGGAFNPNPQFSTLACAGSATMSGGINMSNTTLQLSQFTSNGAVAYYNAGDSNIYITAPSTATVRLGAQDGTSALQVSGTGVNIPGLLTASNAFISSLSSSEIVTPNLQTAGNQVTIQQSNSLGATAVFGWPNATQVNLGMIAANASDGMSFVCDNGGVYISGGGGHFSLSNVSSINGSAPALTSYTQQDVGALFSTLFAANPSLSTITF